MGTHLKPAVSEKDHVQGNANATIELVEYGDYQCPHCGRAYPVIKKIQEALGDKLKFVFRNFPLAEIHPNAIIAALATEAADRQGKYWEMHDVIFENQQTLEVADLAAFAEQLGLDLGKFKDDINDQALSDKVDNDLESGVRSGVNGTPSFFVNGEKYNDSWDYDTLLGYLNSL